MEKKRYIITIMEFDKNMRWTATAKLFTVPMTLRDFKKCLRKKIKEYPNAIWDAKTRSGEPIGEL